jgi:hypothetical protein
MTAASYRMMDRLLTCVGHQVETLPFKSGLQTSIGSQLVANH